jgi:hypothetical protein
VEIEVAQALYTLRRLPGEELSRVGVDLLQSGVDTQAVRELAGAQSNTLRDSGELFERVLLELRRPNMSARDAALVIARDLAKKVVAGAMLPRDAAERGSSLCPDAQYDELLTPFLAYADDYECYPGSHARIDAEVIEHSRKLLAGEPHGAV